MNGRPSGPPQSYSNGLILQPDSINLAHHAEGAGSNVEANPNASQTAAATTGRAEAAQNSTENGRPPSASHGVDIDIRKVQDALASLDMAIYKQAGRLLNLTQKINDEAGLPERLWGMRGPAGRDWEKEPSVARQSTLLFQPSTTLPFLVINLGFTALLLATQ